MANIIRKGGIGVKELQRRVKEVEKLRVEIGWFESAKYDSKTPIASVAATQEYGSPTQGIPPRPFLRTAINDNKQVWRNIFAAGAKAILQGKATAEQVLEQIGLKASGDIKISIKNLNEPALSPKTIKARQSKRADKKKVGNLTKPLVDQGIMINSVTYRVG